MDQELNLLFEDYSTLKRLKERNLFVWISLIVLGILFVPVLFLSVYFAIFGFFSYMSLPQYYRPILAMIALYIFNVFLVSIFGKPIKIYKEGVDLGTVGSLGWTRTIFLGVVYYWHKTKFIAWKDIKTIQIEPSIKMARVLKLTSTKGQIYYCRIEQKRGDEFYSSLTKAITRVVRQNNIIKSN